VMVMGLRPREGCACSPQILASSCPLARTSSNELCVGSECIAETSVFGVSRRQSISLLLLAGTFFPTIDLTRPAQPTQS
jgi:hypothetical protein